MKLIDIPEKICARIGLTKIYSYFLTIKHKNIIFIWIPKTAGTSIFSALTPYGCRKLTSIRSVKYYFPQHGFVTFGHISYQKLKEESYISSKFDSNSFKFCFVRNPWDRVVSLYHYLKRINFIHKNLSFRTFLYEIEDDAMFPVGLYHSKGISQCNNQLDWITDSNGKVFVDFIGRYENIQYDFKELCQKLDIRAELPKRNITQHRKYTEYFDNFSKKIVEKAYSRDIEFFGYKYGE
ncbi:MAG: sulfotransferase family 2 domain-containing protein [Candidatus Aminicenantaceae bacterium]